MSDEYYFEKEDDEEHFFSQEEEQHFYGVLSDYIELMHFYDPNFVLQSIQELIKERETDSLNSLN